MGRAFLRLSFWWSTAIVVAGFATVGFLSGFHLGQFTVAASFCLAIVGLNIVSGLAGQISLAQGAFFAVGAYVTALVQLNYGPPLPLAPICGAVVAAVLGLVAGLPAIRLRSHYLAIVTIGLSVAVIPLANRWSSVTGGGAGLSLGRAPVPEFIPLEPEQYLYLWALLLVGVTLHVASRVSVSSLGLAMAAVRDNEVAARGMGVQMGSVKTGAFAASAFFGGLGGGVYALSVGFVAPENFTPTLSMMLLVGAVIGGLRFVPGAVIGALFIHFTPEYAATIDKHLAGVIFGFAIVAFIRFMPNGVFEKIAKSVNRN